jgi:hypothetical protein
MRRESLGAWGQRSSGRPLAGVIKIMQPRKGSSGASPPGSRPARKATLLAFAFLVAACSARSSGTVTANLPESCEAFVAKYEASIKASVPSLPALAKERAAQTRAALEKEAQRATTPASLSALATKCQSNLQNLPTRPADIKPTP